jgi:hypothetical protein
MEIKKEWHFLEGEVLEIESTALCMHGKSSTNELYSHTLMAMFLFLKIALGDCI